MPTNITPVSTWSTAIPTPDDGEGATGAGLDGFAQALANREEYLKTQVDSTGVRRIREAADLTALAALAVTGTGDKCYVLEKGVYRYDAGSAATVESPWVIASGSGGRWIHELNSVRAANLATLSAGRVVQLPPHALVSSTSVEISGSITANHFFTASSSWTDVTSASVSFTNVQGSDVIMATLSTRAITGSTPLVANSCRVRLAYELLGSTTAIASTEVEIGPLAAGAPPPVIALSTRKAISGVVTWTGADPHIIKLQVIADGTTQSRIMFPVVLSAMHIRP